MTDSENAGKPTNVQPVARLDGDNGVETPRPLALLDEAIQVIEEVASDLELLAKQHRKIQKGASAQRFAWLARRLRDNTPKIRQQCSVIELQENQGVTPDG